MTEYRNAMAGYVRESHRMIGSVLEPADFDEAFPYIFGEPTEEAGAVFFLSECGLLLRKAQLHMTACLVADKNNNLHSLGVHMRVVMECAAEVVATAQTTHEGTPKALARTVNRLERAFQVLMTTMSRGTVTPSDIQSTIERARRWAGETGSRPPKRVTVADRMVALPHGVSWYNHLSESFCHTDAERLSEISFRGGVLSVNTPVDHLAFATLLDYLGHLAIVMLFAFGFLLKATAGKSSTFDDAHELLKRKRSATAAFRRSEPGGHQEASLRSRGECADG